jgi:DNA-binding winged helix-turn-helix (wHTH) protein
MTALAIAMREPAELASTHRRYSQSAPTGVLSFPPFRLDLVEERLWKGERELKLRRKPFALLRYLAQNPRRLVSQAELVDAVWGRIAMSESLLRTHMRDLRRVLGETVIETVVGRGYRFIANIASAEDSAMGPDLHAVDLSGATRPGTWPSPGLLPAAPGPATFFAPLNALHADAIKRLRDALEALGTSATVVVIVEHTRGTLLEPLAPRDLDVGSAIVRPACEESRRVSGGS